MTPSDLDLSIRLARFMGWDEVKHPDTTRGMIDLGKHYLAKVQAWYCMGDEVRLALGASAWSPLTNPAHAALVMVEAARKGWEVRTRMTANFSFASVWKIDIEQRLVDRIGAHQEPHTANETAVSWCRAVGLAVVAAVEREGDHD